MPVPQSALVAQTTHALSRQWGAVVGQFASVMHTTHPGGTLGAVQRTGAGPPLLLLPAPLLLELAVPLPLLLELVVPLPLLLELVVPLPLLLELVVPLPLLLELVVPLPLLLELVVPLPLLLELVAPLPLLLLPDVASPALASDVGVTDESPPHCHKTRGSAVAKGPKKEIHWMVRRVFMASTGGGIREESEQTLSANHAAGQLDGGLISPAVRRRRQFMNHLRWRHAPSIGDIRESSQHRRNFRFFDDYR